MSLGRTFGAPMHVSPALPLAPTDGERARRLVRHAFAGVYTNFEDWAGPVGPAPGDKTHVIMIRGAYFLSQEMLDRLIAEHRR